MVTQESFPLSAPEIDTLLFDLDETLVHINRSGLDIRFLFMTANKMKSLIPIWKFYNAFWRAVKKSKTHGTSQTNHHVFLETLASYAKSGSLQEIDKTIQSILTNDFQKFKDYFKPVPRARETILLAKGLGYKVVVATNPSTPLSMVKQRLEWANLGDVQFDYITHSEVMTRCKPDPEFYTELLTKLCVDARKCLMIGNDLKNDLIAQKVGILTFILETPKFQSQIKSLKKEFGSKLSIQGFGSYLILQEWLVKSKPQQFVTINHD